MTSLFRRYQILLPLRFNDGSPVPDEFFGKVVLDLRKKFGAVTTETRAAVGEWEYQEKVFRDELARIFADVPDTPENRAFFQAYKDELKTRFVQIDILITTFPIEVI